MPQQFKDRNGLEHPPQKQHHNTGLLTVNSAVGTEG